MKFAFLPIYYEFSISFHHFFITVPASGGLKPAIIEPLTPEEFYRNKALSDMLLFFENLPRQFKNFLSLMHEFIKKSKNPSDQNASSRALKELLMNRFLFDSDLKQVGDVIMTSDSSSLKTTANYFKDLFHPRRLDKYSHIPNLSQLSSEYVRVFNQVLSIFTLPICILY